MTKDKSNVNKNPDSVDLGKNMSSGSKEPYKKTFNLKKTGRGKPTFNHKQFTTVYRSKEAAVTPLKKPEKLNPLLINDGSISAIAIQQVILKLNEVIEYVNKQSIETIKNQSGTSPETGAVNNSISQGLLKIIEQFLTDLDKDKVPTEVFYDNKDYGIGSGDIEMLPRERPTFIRFYKWLMKVNHD